jgi:uncharacterized membrane protein YfcA
MSIAALTALILFGATLVSATFGFGSALFAMPLLTLLLGLKTATPLFGLVGPTISGVILLTHWRRVEWASTWRLVLATLVGIPFGVWGLKSLPTSLMVRAIGGLLVAYGVYRFSGLRLPKVTEANWALLFGVVAGMLGGAYNTNGPPVVVYGNMRQWTPSQFRASLQGYFFPTGLGILVSHGVGQLWTPDVFQLYGIALPGILGAIALGSWLSGRLDRDRFQVGLSVLIILLGLMLWT